MAEYRLFEKNLITNEWIDRGWHSGDNQQDVLREVGVPLAEYFVVPRSSFHPVRLNRVETVRWEKLEGEEPTVLAIGEDDGEGAA